MATVQLHLGLRVVGGSQTIQDGLALIGIYFVLVL